MPENARSTGAGDLASALLAGAAAGLAGSFVMNRFQYAWIGLSSGDEGEDGGKKEEDGTEEAQAVSEDDPATVKLADRITTGIAGHEIHGGEKKVAGPLVHYGLGTALGAAYGTLVEADERAAAGSGAAFGVVSMLVLDEAAVPLAGLGPPPTASSPSVHAFSLLSHIVYGVATELTR